MTYFVMSGGEILGRVITNHDMTLEEVCDVLGIKIAKTENDFEYLPDNGMYDIDDLNLITWY